VDVNERLPLPQTLPLSLQHLFAKFGAPVLVPFLVGLDLGAETTSCPVPVPTASTGGHEADRW
jgi:xanthine/uracil permease